jgi:hypothetical protein
VAIGADHRENSVKVTFTTDHDSDIHSLYHWLSSDRDLARSVEVATPTGTDREAMGAIDTIAAVSSSAIGAAQLALAVVAWRGTRPAGPRMTISRPDGHQLTITGGDAATVETITQFFAGGTPTAQRRPKRRPRP